MRLLFVADGRSPTTKSWMEYWLDQGHETHLVSTYPCEPMRGLASLTVIPAAFGSMAGSPAQAGAPAEKRKSFIRQMRGALRHSRYYLGPLSLPFYRRRFEEVVERIKPELIQALRIPFEGMLASMKPRGIPLVISIWGNDLTLHGNGSPLMRRLTRQTLARASALMADTERDVRLAREWGLPEGTPTLVIPGSGGIRLPERMVAEALPGSIAKPTGSALIINPRGQRPGSLRQDVFFRSIPEVLEQFPAAQFACPALKGDPQASKWVQDLQIGSNVRLLPRLEQADLWALMRQAVIYVSPSLHDGTPNSLLEAMACGCFPVVGDIDSMREWIRAGENGLLVDANSTSSVAGGMLRALQDRQLRESAKKLNASIIAARAEYGHCMARAEAFFSELVEKERG